MKRILFALVLVALSLAVVSPALAMETCEHDMTGMHDATLASLVDHVKHAREMNHIATDDLANSLLDKLYAAQAAEARGQVRVAVNNVNAFMNQVKAQSGKAIAADCADHFLMQADHVVMALRGEM